MLHIKAKIGILNLYFMNNKSCRACQIAYYTQFSNFCNT